MLNVGSRAARLKRWVLHQNCGVPQWADVCMAAASKQLGSSLSAIAVLAVYLALLIIGHCYNATTVLWSD